MKMIYDEPVSYKKIVVLCDGTRHVIRSLHTGDEDLLIAFNQSLSDLSREKFLPHEYSKTKIQQYIKRNMAGKDFILIVQPVPEKYTGALDELKQQPVIAYAFLWEFSTSVPLLGIGVTDAWQGKKLGSHIMNVLIKTARKYGKSGIDLTTLPDNDNAYKLYKNLGFIHVGDVRNIAGDGSIIIERRMFLPLKKNAKPSERKFGPPV